MAKAKGSGSGYAVGHGKPPKHTQFKPGQSGNPKGKPKGKLPTMTLISKQLEAKLTVTIAGQPKQMTRREALITALIRDFVMHYRAMRGQGGRCLTCCCSWKPAHRPNHKRRQAPKRTRL